MFIWNGLLLTTPSTSAEKRLSLRDGVARDRAHQRHVLVLDAAAERVGQQLLGRDRDELIGVARRQPVAQLPPARRSSCCRTAAPSDRPACLRRACATGRCRRSSRARSRSDPSGGGTARSPARTRWSSIFWRIVGSFALPVASARGGSGGTSGGGSGGLMPRMLRHDPLAARHRRRALGLRASSPGTRPCRAGRGARPCRDRA